MRSIEDIAETGAAWVTDAELAMLCAFAKRAETSEAEVEGLLRTLAAWRPEGSEASAEIERLGDAIRALVEAGDLIATWCPSDHRGVWAEAKRKAGL